MGPDAEKVYTAIGILKSEVSNLADRFDNLDERITAEQRKVHDIVDATSEAMRNLVRALDNLQRLVEEMKPLTDDYRERRAEQRGEDKFKKWLYGLIASAGAGAAVLIGKIIDWLSQRPHVPVIAVIVLAITLVATAGARGHDSWINHQRITDTASGEWCCQQDLILPALPLCIGNANSGERTAVSSSTARASDL